MDSSMIQALVKIKVTKKVIFKKSKHAV